MRREKRDTLSLRFLLGLPKSIPSLPTIPLMKPDTFRKPMERYPVGGRIRCSSDENWSNVYRFTAKVKIINVDRKIRLCWSRMIDTLHYRVWSGNCTKITVWMILSWLKVAIKHNKIRVYGNAGLSGTVADRHLGSLWIMSDFLLASTL